MGKMSTSKKLQMERMIVNHFEVNYIARCIGVSESTVARQCARMNKIEKVRSLYDAGLSTKIISEKTGISISSVYGYIKEIEQRRKINKVISMVKEGKSSGAIAIELGLPLNLVNFYRKEYCHE